MLGVQIQQEKWLFCTVHDAKRGNFRFATHGERERESFVTLNYRFYLHCDGFEFECDMNHV